jgi:phosphoenolpyruvate-protein kinase (PTS system EI component)
MAADSSPHEADFFSIGTNDLAQYTLAMDRGHPKLAPFVDGLNPGGAAQLIALDHRGRARRIGKLVGVCGGIAERSRTPCRSSFGLGVDELSVSLPAIPAVKAQIRKLDLAECRALAQRALAAESAEAVRALLPETDSDIDGGSLHAS